jgi:hypothetical protein
MKKKFIFILALLPLVSCGRNAPVSSSSVIDSVTSSSSLLSGPAFYQQALMAGTDYFKIARSGTIKKDDKTYYSSTATQTIDLTHKIEHLYSRVTTFAGYDENLDTTTVESDVYSTADAVYRKGYDYKYHVEEGVSIPTSAYT